MCVASIYGHVYGRYQMKCNIYQGGYMSQIKYTAFNNFLIVLLQNSGVWCSIRRFLSIPVGYADDLAACRFSEIKLDGVLKVVVPPQVY